MQKLWAVMLPWAWNGEASDEEGTYSTAVEGEDEDDAKRNAAIEMADSGEKHFTDDDERGRYIESRVAGWGDVYRKHVKLEEDLSSVFWEELFPNGQRKPLNIEALGRVLSENRTPLLAA